MSIPSDPLHAALAAYCRDAQARLVELIAASARPFTRTSFTVTYENSTTHSVRANPVVDWALIVTAGQSLLDKIPSRATALEALALDPALVTHLGHTVGTAGFQYPFSPDDTLERFLVESIDFDGDGTFNQTHFDGVFVRFRRFTESPRVWQEALAPLSGFWMDETHIKLGEHLIIRELTAPEQDRILSSPFAQSQRFDVPRFALAYMWAAPKYIDGTDVTGGSVVGDREPEEVLLQVLDALRLFKSGGVALGRIARRPVDWNVFGVIGSGGRVPEQLGSGYVLGATEVEGFLDFWNWYLGTRPKKRMAACLRRFHYGYERLRVDDRLVDHVIALEALLDDGDRQELAYRFSFRAAALLGTNSVDRQVIFERMQRAYKGRSLIVHGNAADAIRLDGLPYASVDEFQRAFESDVRRAIVSFMRLSESRDEKAVVRELDARIIRGDYALPDSR